MAVEPKKIEKIPVTILTGFLGAGKTTLLNWILKAEHGLKLAVIENEFGQVGVDQEIVIAKENSKGIMIEVKNGCICCTVRNDLVECLANILQKTEGNLDGIIIETTGMADPAPVCQTFFVEESIEPFFRIDSVITVVDAKNLIMHLKEEKPDGAENESEEQLAFADKILLNKIDLIKTKEELKAIKKEIREINSFAPILETCLNKEVPDMKEFFNVKGFDLKRVEEMEPDFLNEDPGDHIHDKTIGSVGYVFNEDEQLTIFKFENLVADLMKNHNEDLYRYKGVMAIKGFDKKFLFQGVHMLFNHEFSSNWGPNEKRVSRFCFIGKNLEKMDIEKRFRDAIAKPLRFKVGDKVLVNCECVDVNCAAFKPGTVAKLWDDGNPYSIRLDEEEKDVWAPQDIDRYVKLQ